MHALREMLPLSFWLISIGMLVLYSGERFGSSLLLTSGICLLALILLAPLWKWRRQTSLARKIREVTNEA